MRFWLTVFCLLLPTAASAQLDPTKAAQILGFIAAATEYCPGIEARPEAVERFQGAMPNGDDHLAISVEKYGVFRQLEREGSRAETCDLMMRLYGPGASLQLLRFK